MTEEKLLACLTELRQRDTGAPAETRMFPHPGGLTFSRAWELAKDPSGMTAAERSHLEECRRCAHLLQSAQHELQLKSQPLEQVATREVAEPGPSAGTILKTPVEAERAHSAAASLVE